MRKGGGELGCGESLWEIALLKMQIFTGLLIPVFISSRKSWIRNIEPAQRISIIWRDGADPAEVLLSGEPPPPHPLQCGSRHLRTWGGKNFRAPELGTTSCCRALVSLHTRGAAEGGDAMMQHADLFHEGLPSRCCCCCCETLQQPRGRR